MLFILLLVAIVNVSALNFLAVGDWGGNENPPYYTPGQMASVTGMDKIAKQLNAEFVLAVGDNFYHEGVIDENDARFQQSFESVYTPASLQKPWYAIAGNHDYKGNVSAQIAYTQHSQRWKFPSNYHAHSFRAKDGATIDIIMIDTVDLTGFTPKAEHEEGYFDPLPLKSRAYASNQWAWIEGQLATSRADYILVVGHYPVYSICSHGPTRTLVELLRPMLQKYNAQYLSGHDHCMEHMVDTDTATVNYFLSGIGVECCYAPIYRHVLPEGLMQWYMARDVQTPDITAGFTSFEVNKSAMTVAFYDQAGNTLYTAPSIAPRK